MTGEVVYSDFCNGYNQFVVDPDQKISQLQLYKYELAKDGNDKLFLKGYNPVNK